MIRARTPDPVATRAVGTAIARSGAERLIDEKLGGEAGEAVKSLLNRFMK